MSRSKFSHKDSRRGVIHHAQTFAPQVVAHVTCHGCGREITIDARTVRVQSRVTGFSEEVTPCTVAPYICESCRADRKRLKAAREAMDEHFAQKEHERAAA